MKKFLSILLVVVLSLSAFSACTSTDDSVPSTAEPAVTGEGVTEEAEKPAETTTGEKTRVRVAYMPNMGSASALATAEEQGYFDEVGLDVQTVQFQGGPAEISAMASGDIDIAQIGHGAHALAAEGQALVFQLDCTSLADAVIGNTEKGVNSIADLKGKRVATTAGTSAEIILDLALQSEGLTQADIEVIEMDANGIVSAMISGNIDACATWSPSTMTILNQMGDKAITLANNETFVSQVTFPSSFITTQKYVDGNEETLVKFSQAIQKAMDYRAANIEEVCGYVAKMVEVDLDTMLQSKNEGNWLTSDFINEGLADGTVKKYYENQQQIFVESGRIAEEVDVDTYVLFDIMQKAYDENHK